MCACWAVMFLLSVASASAIVADKERPVTKVLNLLKDMSAQLQKEADKDEELFENFKCWCATYGKEKTKAVESANQMIEELTTTIEEANAKQAQLETEIDSLTKEVAQKTKALHEAEGIRTKENSEFTGTENDLTASIASLGGAVKTLGAAHGEGLTQESMVQVQSLLRRHLKQYREVLTNAFTTQQHKAVASFLQQPAAAQSYASQSGAIFGILKGMKETFEANLVTSQNDEKNAKNEFGSLKSAQTRQLSAAKEQIDSNTAELSDTKVKLANGKDGLEDTRAALTADTAFLSNLKSKCAGMDQQWESRQKMRNDEMTAVSETIKILSDDEAHDTFSRSDGLVQVRRSMRKIEVGLGRRVALRSHGAKLKSKQLATIAVSVHDNVFAEVKTNIEGLINNLKKTQEEEVKERISCLEDINLNEDQTTAANNHKADLEQKIEDLKATIEAATSAVSAAKEEIFETHVAMKQAGGNRAAQNREFQQTIADQRATQAILKKASVRLEDFYKSKALLLQKGRRQDPGAKAPAAPEGFGEYKKAGGATGALGLLEMIIKESAAEEKQATQDEQEAQQDYEGFMKDSFSTVSALTDESTDQAGTLAKADGEKAMADTDLANTKEDVLNLGDQNRQLHRRCDYLLDNYDVRQSARADEIDSLENAKAMFSGAKFDF